MTKAQLFKLIKAAPSGLFIFLCAVLIWSCSSKENAPSSPAAKVVAKVNEEIITEDDVNYLLEKLMAGSPRAQIDNSLRSKVIDSLVASRAMKLKVKQELSQEELQAIAQATKNYEEELFVKAYLQRNITPEPVTEEMVKDYYNQHPDQFGAYPSRSFQLLKLEANAPEDLRNTFLAHAAEIRSDSDWGSKRAQYEKKYKLTYQEGKNAPGLLNDKLNSVLSGLSKNQTSNFLNLDDGLYLVRVTNVEDYGPKALSLVSAGIRKTLAAQQLKAAVKKATEESLTGLSVKKDF